ncbi:MAG: vitamin K epoxide reductase family protein [Candidatus Beckwithbacteria bacterium]|nr:vitamin K epoxide reductase family protein [Candidatus Beckwithbacteria bacterium]
MKLSVILCLIGILLASYLFYNYLAVIPSGLCNISQTVNCEAVTKGNLATLFGIPVSLVGLIGYILILYASLMKLLKLHLFMSTFGMLFCLRLTYLEIFMENVLCPVCLACQLVMLTLFIISLKLLRKPLPQSN